MEVRSDRNTELATYGGRLNPQEARFAQVNPDPFNATQKPTCLNKFRHSHLTVRSRVTGGPRGAGASRRAWARDIRVIGK